MWLVRDYTILQHGTDQLTSDRKYETVESAELPQTQLFVIDLPPNSIQCPVEHFSQDSLATFCQKKKKLPVSPQLHSCYIQRIF